MPRAVSREPVRRRLLNAGSGPRSARGPHSAFQPEVWEEVRLDISPTAKPDVVGSLTELSSLFPPQTFDAVWASHVLEHLFRHEVPVALSQMRRVLKKTGFVVITSPDLEAAARIIVERGLDYVAYVSPAGPITAHDMVFGHTASIAKDLHYMAHRSGFTCASLADRLLEAGFPTVLAKNEQFDLWAVGLMEGADTATIQAELAAGGLDMRDAPC